MMTNTSFEAIDLDSPPEIDLDPASIPKEYQGPSIDELIELGKSQNNTLYFSDLPTENDGVTPGKLDEILAALDKAEIDIVDTDSIGAGTLDGLGESEKPDSFYNGLTKEELSEVLVRNQEWVRIYLTQMGEIPLFTREEEVNVTHRKNLERSRYQRAVFGGHQAIALYPLKRAVQMLDNALTEGTREDSFQSTVDAAYLHPKPENTEDHQTRVRTNRETLKLIIEQIELDISSRPKRISKREAAQRDYNNSRRLKQAYSLLEEIGFKTKKTEEIWGETKEKYQRAAFLIKELGYARSKHAPARRRAHQEELETLGQELGICKTVSYETIDSAIEAVDSRYRQYTSTRSKLVAGNLRLVVSIAKNYMHRGLEFVDLLTAGNIGLISAAEKFNEKLGYKFSTYATWWIRQAVSREIENRSRTIRAPSHIYQAYPRVYRAARQHFVETGREATYEELAERVDLPVGKVKLIIESGRYLASFDKPIGEKEETTLRELVEDERSNQPDKTAAQLLLEHRMGEVLDTLTYREREIIKLRFGIGSGYTYTLNEIAPIFGVTRERVRQIEAKALRKLQHPTRARKLEGFLDLDDEGPTLSEAMGGLSMSEYEAARALDRAGLTVDYDSTAREYTKGDDPLNERLSPKLLPAPTERPKIPIDVYFEDGVLAALGRADRPIQHLEDLQQFSRRQLTRLLGSERHALQEVVTTMGEVGYFLRGESRN